MVAGAELDALVARFLGYEVKPLADWPDANEHGPWWPAHDRTTLVRTVWTVAAPDDLLCRIEAKHPEGEYGAWIPWLIPKYSKHIHEAWNVFKRIHEIDGTAKVSLAEVALLQDEMGATQIAYGDDAAHAICLAAKWLSEHPLVVETHRRRR